MGAQTAKAAEIFDAAVELGTPAERMAFLVTACGDDTQLRAAVEDLLAHDADAGSFLNRPTLAGEPHVGLGMRPGTVIGRYKLLEQIGEGGMGTVFMAEQTHPVQRKVALKIIKAGMDSRQVIARFEAERQALALMDHPNIARVLDAGTTGEAAQGSPYFVMELVKGVPITRYCDDNHLKPKERLELFIPICQAVQHAHQKGIIHRDLKPSNVMICQYDGKPVPKIIDFGVAKAIRQKLTEQTLFTEFGSVVGTLEYMSPEQAELNQLDIDTRSDIYSLGVLLYELLTGTTPLERGRVKEAAFVEVLRLIREEEPPKPSTRLSKTQGLPSIAANRGSDPGKLGGLVRGELDWIVMKCLEKDRNRRYETANGLARDIERYLADEAVQACPPSAQYRLRKFARRNKRALATAALLAGTLIVAVVLLSVSNRRLQVEQKRTTNEYHRAEAQKVVADQQRAKAEAQKTVADAQRAEAEDRLKLVFEALDEVFVKEAETQALLHGHAIERQASADPQREKAEREFLEKGLGFYERLSQRPGTTPAARAEIGRALRRVGAIQHRLGHNMESEHALRESLQLFQALARESAEPGEYVLDQLDTLQWLYEALADTDRDPEAERVLGQTLTLFQELPPEFRNQQQSRELLARCHYDLGHLQDRTGRKEEAIRELYITGDLYRQMTIDFPKWRWYRDVLAQATSTLGNFLERSGRPREALTAYRESASIFQKLIADTPADPPAAVQGPGANPSYSSWYYHELGYACIKQGELLLELGELPEAEGVLSRGLEVHRKLVADFPAVAHYKPRLAWNLLRLADLRKAQGRRPEAEQTYREATATMEQAGLADRFFGFTYEHLTNLYQEEGRIPQAIEASHKWVAAWEKVTSASGTRDNRRHLAFAARTSGNLYKQTNNLQEAAGAYRRSLPLWEGLVREQPDNADVRSHLHQTYRAVIDLPLEGHNAGDWKPVIDALEKSIESRNGGDAHDLFFLIIARSQLGEKQDARKGYDRAVQWTAKNDPQSEELERIRAEAEKAMEESGGGQPEKTRPKN